MIRAVADCSGRFADTREIAIQGRDTFHALADFRRVVRTGELSLRPRDMRRAVDAILVRLAGDAVRIRIGAAVACAGST